MSNFAFYLLKQRGSPAGRVLTTGKAWIGVLWLVVPATVTAGCSNFGLGLYPTGYPASNSYFVQTNRSALPESYQSPPAGYGYAPYSTGYTSPSPNGAGEHLAGHAAAEAIEHAAKHFAGEADDTPEAPTTETEGDEAAQEARKVAAGIAVRSGEGEGATLSRGATTGAAEESAAGAGEAVEGAAAGGEAAEGLVGAGEIVAGVGAAELAGTAVIVGAGVYLLWKHLHPDPEPAPQ